MLPFDFDYYHPGTLKEAVELFQTLERQGRQPMYFSGGTELITLGRIDLAYSDAVIDLKKIPDLRAMHVSEGQLVLGSALSLAEVEEGNMFPLLSKTAGDVADHTSREKITLGGNICARIFYREAVLPFLLADSHAVIFGPEGVKTVWINDIFQKQLQLKKGEVLVQLITEMRAAEAPFVSIKRRQQWKIGYPLVTIAALKLDGEIRTAVSGLCPFPFRSREIETILNQRELPLEERAKQALDVLPSPILDDVEGSADYRLFVLKNVLLDVMQALGSDQS